VCDVYDGFSHSGHEHPNAVLNVVRFSRITEK
jgi:hypothetical protein